MGSGNFNNNNNNSNRNSNCESEQRICVAHQINGLEYTAAGRNADSFILDIERFSPPPHHLSDKKDVNPNSRVTLQRSLSRKGSTQKKSNNSDTTTNNLVAATSPRDTSLHSSSTPEKSMVVTMGSTEHAVIASAQLHNAITIINVAGNSGSGGGGGTGTGTPSESKIGGRRFSFKRSYSSYWTVSDPRRIFLIFTAISCMGTTLLIYLTLSLNKLSGEDNGLN